jgi:hypothetical protein
VEVGYLVDDFTRLLVEMLYQILEINLTRHAWLRMGNTVYIIVLKMNNGGKDRRHVLAAWFRRIQLCCHTLGKEFLTNVIDSFL